jgi:hypothetical protein
MNRLPNRLPASTRVRVLTARDDVQARNRRLALRAGALTAAVLAMMALTGKPAHAVDSSVDFGTPTVLSQQGQRLKVLVPVRSAKDDRATAASFLVRETEVPQGHQPLPAQSFTVMRPAQSDYVVLQSNDIVRAPQVALLVSVAGDPKSPYRVDVQVPPPSAIGSNVAMAGSDAGSKGRRGTATRKLRGPAGDATLPPK